MNKEANIQHSTFNVQHRTPMTRQTPKPKTPGEHPTSNIQCGRPWLNIFAPSSVFVGFPSSHSFDVTSRRDKELRVEGDGGTSNTQHRIQTNQKSEFNREPRLVREMFFGKPVRVFRVVCG